MGEHRLQSGVVLNVPNPSTFAAVPSKTLLELVHSDPFIVLDHADLGVAVSSTVRSRLLIGGQSCLAAKRFIVHEGVVEDFVT